MKHSQLNLGGDCVKKRYQSCYIEHTTVTYPHRKRYYRGTKLATAVTEFALLFFHDMQHKLLYEARSRDGLRHETSGHDNWRLWIRPKPLVL